MKIDGFQKDDEWMKVVVDCADHCDVSVADVIAVGTYLYPYLRPQPQKLPRKTNLKELRAVLRRQYAQAL